MSRFNVIRDGKAWLIFDSRDDRVIALSMAQSDAQAISDELNRRNAMSIRAKFRLISVEPNGLIRAEAVTADSEENKSWSKWTPGGQLFLNITNPDALVQFAPDGDLCGEFYLDLTKIPADGEDTAEQRIGAATGGTK